MADETSSDDILEHNGGRRFRWPDWRPSRGAEALVVAALVVGLAAGYAAGNSRPGGAAAPRPTVTVTAPPPGSMSATGPAAPLSLVASSALIQDVGACSVQTGHELQLGIQFTNQSAQPVTLMSASAVLPLGGLKLVTWQWGTCGALAAGVGQGGAVVLLLPGESTWLTATLKVQLGCPAPLPVQFSVGFQIQGHSVTASLPGFPDLGQVPYTGCSAAGTSTSITSVELQTTR